MATAYDQWITAVFNEENHKVEREVDGLGRLIQVREYLGANPYTWYATTSYGYNVRDQLTDVWDQAGNHTQVSYDLLGRKTGLTDPDMGAWSYVYDPRGNLTRQTDARSQVIDFTYDAMSRVTLKDLPGGTADDVHYCYDNCLNDASAANSWGKLRRAYVGTSATTNAHQYKYDARGRTSWERVTLDTVNYDTSYAYDSADRVKTMAYPDGVETVTNGYLPNGQLNTVSSSLGTVYVGSITYTPWGAPNLMELGPHASPVLQVDYNYYSWTGGGGEGRARLFQVVAGVPADLDSLQDLRYWYDVAGNVETIQDYKAGGTQTQSFTYDDLDRLLSAAASGGTGGTYSEAYQYGDAQGGKLGNLTSKGGVAYTYGTQSGSCPDGALNKPHAVVTAGSNTFCYDRNGNMVKRNSGAYTLAYDAENRLTGVAGGPGATFVYGPGGERVKGTVGSTTTYYIGAHYEKQGSTIRKYYYAGGTRVAMRDSSLTPALHYLLADHLGSQAVTVYGEGTYVGTERGEVRYKAFGEDRYTSGTTPTTYRYTGQRHESGIGLYYYGARWYDPSLGRFIQPDTIVPQRDDPQQLNRYAYAANSPVLYRDPSGHAVVEGINTESSGDPCRRYYNPGGVTTEEVSTNINNTLIVGLLGMTGIGAIAATPLATAFVVQGASSALGDIAGQTINRVATGEQMDLTSTLAAAGVGAGGVAIPDSGTALGKVFKGVLLAEAQYGLDSLLHLERPSGEGMVGALVAGAAGAAPGASKVLAPWVEGFLRGVFLETTNNVLQNIITPK